MYVSDFDLKKGQRGGTYPDGGRLDLPYSVVLPYITIESTRIEDELVSHAAKYAYLAYFIAEAKARTASLKNDIDAMKGALFLDAKTQGEIKMTDEMAKSWAQQSPDMIELRKELAEAEGIEVYWTNVMNAMQQRGFLLKELANRDFREKTSPHSLNNYNESLMQMSDPYASETTADDLEEAIRRSKQY